MNNTSQAVAELLNASESIVDLLSGSKNASIKSLEAYNPVCAEYDLIRPDSRMKVYIDLEIEYHDLFEIYMPLTFRSFKTLRSIDKAEAIQVIQTSGFECGLFKSEDEWTADDELFVQIRTKYKEIADWIADKDESVYYSLNDDDNLYHVGIVDGSAASIIEYIANQASLTFHDFIDNHTELGKQILAAMREAAVARLEEAVAKVA